MERAEGRSMKHIIDISKYQVVTSWAKVTENVDGVILRLGYRGYAAAGNIVKDPRFDGFVKEVISRRIPWGVYFFTTALNAKEAEEEADYCISVLSGLDTSAMTLGVWFDTEWTPAPNHTGRSDYLGRTERTATAVAFCDRISDRLHTTAGIYASDNWFDTKLYKEDIKRYPWWVANYSRVPSNQYLYWQKTSSASIPGIVGRVDLSDAPDANIPAASVQATLKTLKKGSTGNQVRMMQFLLCMKDSEIDGVFGVKTEMDLIGFQCAFMGAAEADGICGPKTWKALFSTWSM